MTESEHLKAMTSVALLMQQNNIEQAKKKRHSVSEGCFS